MASISRFIGAKCLMLLLLLSVVFFNWYGYWYVFAVLPIVYALFFNEIYRYCDKVTILLFLFGVWYSVFATKLSFNEYVSFMFIYPMLYLVGKYIGLSEKSDSIVNIIFVVALSMSAMYLLSISADIVKNGFYSDSRDLEIEGRGSNEEISATGIYSHLMLLTTFISALFMRIPWKRRLLYSIFAILAFVASIRIQSRTGVVIMIIVIILSLLVNFRNMARSNIVMVIILLGSLLFAAGYALTTYEEELGILERFQEDDVESGGYRTELAMNVVNKLTESPWGGLEHMRYAHNMWLDCARVSGIVPLAFLLLITVLYIRSLWRMYKLRTDDSSSRYILVILGMVLFIYMNVEPILEGAPVLFAFFVVLFGIMQGANKYRIKNTQ